MPNWRGLLDSEPIDKFLYDPASSNLLILKTNLLEALEKFWKERATFWVGAKTGLFSASFGAKIGPPPPTAIDLKRGAMIVFERRPCLLTSFDDFWWNFVDGFWRVSKNVFLRLWRENRTFRLCGQGLRWRQTASGTVFNDRLLTRFDWFWRLWKDVKPDFFLKNFDGDRLDAGATIVLRANLGYPLK